MIGMVVPIAEKKKKAPEGTTTSSNTSRVSLITAINAYLVRIPAIALLWLSKNRA